MTGLSVITLVAVMLPLAAMPSASVALVVARSAGSGTRSGIAASAGIVAGDLVFVALALLGMGMLADTLGAFFSVVKYLGGAWLIWLGVGLFRSRSAAGMEAIGSARPALLADFLAGFVLTLGDIKAILFYASLFPVIVDMAAITLWQGCSIMLITAFTVGGVKIAYAVFAPSIMARLESSIAPGLPRKLGGTVLIGCGATLIARA